MINLNLLAPTRRQQHQREETFLLLRNLTVNVWLIILLLFAILGGTRFILTDARDSAHEKLEDTQARTGGPETLSLRQSIRDLNGRVKAIEQIQRSFNPLSRALADLAATVPQSVTVTSVNLDLDGKTLTIRGYAADRDAYLLLGQNLSVLPFLAGIDTPLVTKKTDIDFVISAALTLPLPGL